MLTVAVAEPSNLFLIDEMRGLTQLEVQIVAATTQRHPADDHDACRTRRCSSSTTSSRTTKPHDVTLIEEAIEDIGDVEEIAGQSPVIRLVNYIIFNAVKEGASDIHIEPAERCVRVRYRIDGRLYKSLEVPLHLLTRHQPYQDHGLDGHQRAAPAAGRPRPRDARMAARSTCASAPFPRTAAKRP